VLCTDRAYREVVQRRIGMLCAIVTRQALGDRCEIKPFILLLLR
jgi:hypothetical protein